MLSMSLYYNFPKKNCTWTNLLYVSRTETPVLVVRRKNNFRQRVRILMCQFKMVQSWRGSEKTFPEILEDPLILCL